MFGRPLFENKVNSYHGVPNSTMSPHEGYPWSSLMLQVEVKFRTLGTQYVRLTVRPFYQRVQDARNSCNRWQTR
jgi:hypothetical protein